MTRKSVIKTLLKQGFSGNEIQKLLPSYGFPTRRQVLQGLIREIRNVKKKLSSKPWEGFPQPIAKPRSKTEKWKRAVSTSSRYTNIFYNYYVTFFASWTDEIGIYHQGYFTKFLGLMSFNQFKKNKKYLIHKAETELIDSLAQSPDYEDEKLLELHDIVLIEIFRHKQGILK